MSTVINTNLASLYAQNNLSNAQNNLATSVMRLSSGLRINSAKDDAAGLAISQSMQAQILSVNQSRRNLNDATNLIQVADTSMSTIQEMLLRIKQLGTQGYDGSLSASQRTQIVDEINELNTEINNTATRTKFNGNSLIANAVGVSGGTAVAGLTLTDGTLTQITSAGAKAQTYTLAYNSGTDTLTMTGTDTVAQSLALTGLTAGGTYDLNFDQLGVKLTYVVKSSGVVAADVIGGVLNGKDVVVTGTAPADLTFQGGSDTGTPNIVTYDAINIKTDGSAGDFDIMADLGTIISTLNGYTNTTAQATWATSFSTLGTRVDAAIDLVSEQRSIMGALMNRIAYIGTNLEAQSTNLQSSKSAIVDTDFAAETAKLTKGQIMQQAATAMLAQANQMPNVVLSLLK
jgi:flagellin